MGYPRIKHYDVLDDLYEWGEDLQKSLEAAAEDLAAAHMDEDEQLPLMEEEVRYKCPKGTSRPLDLLYLHLRP